MDDKNLFELVGALRSNELFTCVIKVEPLGMRSDVHTSKIVVRALLENDEEKVNAFNEKVGKILDDHNVDGMLQEIITALLKAMHDDEMEDGEAYSYVIDLLGARKQQNDDNDQVGG